MSYYNIPERRLDPPDDTRKTAYTCKVCGRAIKEGDEYWDIPEFGQCCETCIDGAHHYDAEAEIPDFYGEDD